jgi:hypothetical protein
LKESKKCPGLWRSSSEKDWSIGAIEKPTYLIKDNKLVQFGSTYDWDLIKKYYFEEIPVDLQPLKDQVAKLILIIEEQLAHFNARHLVAEEKSQKYLTDIVNAGSTEYLRRQHVKLRHEASEEEIKHCIGIPEHGFLVKDVSASSKMILGTSFLATCLGLIIFNKESKTIGLAHLDEYTVDLYKTSLDDMFDQCLGQNQPRLYVNFFLLI